MLMLAGPDEQEEGEVAGEGGRAGQREAEKGEAEASPAAEAGLRLFPIAQDISPFRRRAVPAGT
jgi:hypothetical protein